MARKTNPLTDREIKGAEPKEKPYKLFDGGGLYIEIPPKQSKRWRLKYRIDGKEKTISLGTYPAVLLSEARDKAAVAKKLIKEGIDPSAQRRAAKEEAREKERIETEKESKRFQTLASEYIEHYRDQKAPSYWPKVERAFERDVFPFIGHLPIDEIETEQIIDIAKRIEARGSNETARRIHSQIGRVFRYAIANGKATRDTAKDVDLSMILKPVKGKHYPTLTDPAEVGELMRAIHSYQGATPFTRYALLLLALTAVRPGNVREAQWDEIDIEAKLWRIPAAKMKARKDHLIPLSGQAVTLLEELRPLSGNFPYLFPSPLHLTSPISDGTMNKALKILGYGGQRFTPHSFRSTFSTIAREVGEFPHNIIEFQLGHKEGGAVSQAYNRAQYLPQRRELMQWWADWLDEVTTKGDK